LARNPSEQLKVYGFAGSIWVILVRQSGRQTFCTALVAYGLSGLVVLDCVFVVFGICLVFWLVVFKTVS